MPPGLLVLVPKLVRNADKFFSRHVVQAIVIHNRPTPRRLTVQDVTAGSLGLVLTVDAVGGVYARPSERTTHLLRRCRPTPWQHGDQMKSKVGRGILLQDLERVPAIPAATGLEACGAQFGILFRELGHTGRCKKSSAASPFAVILIKARSPEDCVEVTGPDHDQVPHGCFGYGTDTAV